MTLPNQLAAKQITKPSDNDSITAEFYKNVYQDLSPEKLQIEDLGKQESIRKILNWMKTDISYQSPF